MDESKNIETKMINNATDVTVGGVTNTIPDHKSHTVEFSHPSGSPVKTTIKDKGSQGADVEVSGPHYLEGRGIRHSDTINVPVGQPQDLRTLDDGREHGGIGDIDFGHVPEGVTIAPKGITPTESVEPQK